MMFPEGWQGDWALVTGASSGIGREFAIQLAAAGLNVVLVARREALLEQLAAELRTQHGIQTLALPMDLARPQAARAIRQRLRDANIVIRLLCNNAAFGRWGRWEDGRAAVDEDMIAVNVTALVALCRTFLPDLLAHQTSAIVNLSSPAAYQPVPYMALYAASKAFVASFSQALHEELSDRGVLVQTLVPGPTATEFDAVAGGAPACLGKERASATAVVQAALAHLGGGCPVVEVARGTRKQRLAAALLPRRWLLRILGRRFEPTASGPPPPAARSPTTSVCSSDLQPSNRGGNLCTPPTASPEAV